MRDWYHAFFNAVVFLTRIPAPRHVRFEKKDLDRAACFFPAVGFFVGLVGAGVIWLTQGHWAINLSVALSMAATILLTGAFHEDGLADVCDGFGGGWDKDQILTIMKDSRLGTYGTVGLVLVLLLKWSSLSAMGPYKAMLLLPLAHGVSRWAGVAVIRFGQKATDSALEKPKPDATHLNGSGFFLATLTAVAPMFLLPWKLCLWLLVLTLMVTWGMYRYYLRRVGGYTGDGLGAIQQLTEVTIYLLVAGPFHWNFIY